MRVSGYRSIGLLVVCLAGCEAAWGQAPRISPGGIVNAASLRRGGSPNSAKRSSETEVLALGSIVSIFGEHLAAGDGGRAGDAVAKGVSRDPGSV